jgi:dTDP-glucose 4,6-dehydratase
VSTDEVYGETLRFEPFREDEILNPTNPYAATKVGAESIVRSYYHCFELPIIIVRGNNVYGPRQYPEKMIPKFILSLLQGKPCTLAGNGLMQRNFIYVDDMCRALTTVLQKGTLDNIYNIGTHHEQSVCEIAHVLIHEICDGWNKSAYLTYIEDRHYNDFRYSIDTTKIENLGWKPEESFTTGLQKTIAYYKEKMSLYRDV